MAIKDLIDVEGVPTTAASPAVAATAMPAATDAPCLAGLRAGDAAIVGKANLHELAFGGTGVNRWFGTPRNPLDERRIPGGSSSGSAVAVATGEVDFALGTDTAGSIRTPSACCGTVGLKTTHRRIPTEGVRPLAPSLDVVGPMARDVAGVVTGMEMLDPTFSIHDAEVASSVGRVRVPGTDPRIDAAIDRLLHAAGFEVVEITLTGYAAAVTAGVTVLMAQAWAVNGHLLSEQPERLSPDVVERLEQGSRTTTSATIEAERTRADWQRELAAAWTRTPALVWPVLLESPRGIDEPAQDTRTTNVPVNLAGCPALALPAPLDDGFPASLQIVGPHRSEAMLCATGQVLESAAGTL